MARLEPAERRARLLKERAKLDAQLRGIEAQEREAARKLDTRQKIIAGAIVLEQIARDPTGAGAIQVVAWLDQFVEDRSRGLFPFLPSSGDKTAKASEPKRPILPEVPPHGLEA